MLSSQSSSSSRCPSGAMEHMCQPCHWILLCRLARRPHSRRRPQHCCHPQLNWRHSGKCPLLCRTGTMRGLRCARLTLGTRTARRTCSSITICCRWPLLWCPGSRGPQHRCIPRQPCVRSSRSHSKCWRCVSKHERRGRARRREPQLRDSGKLRHARQQQRDPLEHSANR